MQIARSKNLKYDKLGLPGQDEEPEERFKPEICVIKIFERTDDKLTLHFKNNSFAHIKAVNAEGGKEIDIIEKWMERFIGKTYRDLLDTEF